MKKICSMSYKKIFIIFFLLFIIQFVIALFTSQNKTIGYESKKAYKEIVKEYPELLDEFIDSENDNYKKIIYELAKKIYIEEYVRYAKDYNLRKYIYNSNDKEFDFFAINEEIKQKRIEDPDSYEIIELEYDYEVMKAGYNPINFIMERTLKLSSIHFLKYQTNYFFIIITTICFLFCLILKKLNQK